MKHIGIHTIQRIIALMILYCLISFRIYADKDESEHVADNISTTSAIQKPFFMSVKTNMLYDAITIPNVGAEFYVGHDFSVSAQWMYAWWNNESHHRYWRIYGGDIAVRYWFGPRTHRKPLTGHHAGIYFGGFTFDFEWGGKAYMGGRPGHGIWNRCLINTGIEYGYSLPIARRLNLDFTLGVGYIGGIVEKFHPENNYYIWDATTRITWIGPTKAEVSLVWLIGHDNVNLRKGGGVK